MKKHSYDTGTENAIYNLKDAAKALLGFERLHRIKFVSSRREQLLELANLTPEKLENDLQGKDLE